MSRLGIFKGVLAENSLDPLCRWFRVEHQVGLVRDLLFVTKASCSK